MRNWCELPKKREDERGQERIADRKREFYGSWEFKIIIAYVTAE